MVDTLTCGGFKAAFAAVRSVPVPVHTVEAGSLDPSRNQVSFVTISREGGAGGRTIGQKIVQRLNEIQAQDSACGLQEDPWTLWDKELVEKVSSEHHISRELVESLGDTHQSWMDEFLSSLSQVSDPTEAKVYRRVAMTIRAMAKKGRVVIVGRGGVFVTRHMTGGLHIRLVAPLEHRTHVMARQLGITHEQAAEHVRTLDRNRKAFYRRYWPNETMNAETFTLTINTAQVDEDRAAECVIPLIRQSVQSAMPSNERRVVLAI